jgi:hypothetical protein
MAAWHAHEEEMVVLQPLLGAANDGWHSELQGLKACERVVCAAWLAGTAWAPARAGSGWCMTVGVAPQLNARHLCSLLGCLPFVYYVCSLASQTDVQALLLPGFQLLTQTQLPARGQQATVQRTTLWAVHTCDSPLQRQNGMVNHLVDHAVVGGKTAVQF